MKNHHAQGKAAQGKALFKERFQEIERAVAAVARQKRLTRDQEQELYSLVMLKIVRDDYVALRKFEGRSSWGTYLVIITQRALLDERVSRWGRWRPSARARRLGPVATQLEQHINRDGWSPSEAIRHLQARGTQESIDELEHLAERIPQRPPRRWVPSSPHLDALTDGESADHRLEIAERRRAADKLQGALASALAELPPDERRLLDLRYGRGWTVQRIASSLHLEARPLYRRFKDILRRLRRRLEGAGINWSRIVPTLGVVEFDS